MKRRGKKCSIVPNSKSISLISGKFDYILLETTGLADPAPVAAMFWLDEELGAQVWKASLACHLASKGLPGWCGHCGWLQELFNSNEGRWRSKRLRRAERLAETGKDHSKDIWQRLDWQIMNYVWSKVGVADLIVVNKTDLVEPSHLDHVLQMVSWN